MYSLFSHLIFKVKIFSHDFQQKSQLKYIWVIRRGAHPAPLKWKPTSISIASWLSAWNLWPQDGSQNDHFASQRSWLQNFLQSHQRAGGKMVASLIRRFLRRPRCLGRKKRVCEKKKQVASSSPTAWQEWYLFSCRRAVFFSRPLNRLHGKNIQCCFGHRQLYWPGKGSLWNR